MSGPNHKDGCKGDQFRYSGTGYNRVRVCECGAEDHDPQASSGSRVRGRVRVERIEEGYVYVRGLGALEGDRGAESAALRVGYDTPADIAIGDELTLIYTWSPSSGLNKLTRGDFE